jgi:hypothetical protein
MIRALALSALLVVSAHAAVDVDRLVDALREREGYRGQRGALGEEGPWQFMPSTWAMHMPGRPLAMARDERLARACAVKHVRWLQAQLGRQGVDASAFNIAAAWNAGLTSYVRGRAPVRAYRFAADVVAIYSVRALEVAQAAQHRHDVERVARAAQLESLARLGQEGFHGEAAAGPEENLRRVVGRLVLHREHRECLRGAARLEQDAPVAKLQGIGQRLLDQAVARHNVQEARNTNAVAAIPATDTQTAIQATRCVCLCFASDSRDATSARSSSAAWWMRANAIGFDPLMSREPLSSSRSLSVGSPLYDPSSTAAIISE